MNTPITDPIPRIALSGSAGVGKTALAGALSEALGVPVLAERMRDRLAAGLDLHTLTRAEHRALLADDVDDLAARAEAAGGFVSDGSPLDFAAFWLCNGYAVDDEPGTAALIERARAVMAGWSLVVVLPWGDLPLVADGVRYANPWHQLHAHTVMEGLQRRNVPSDRLHFLPPGLGGIGRRRDWVMERVISAARGRCG